MSLAPPPKVGQLQKTLHAKAKGSPNYRFYALYDKVYRADVLWHAYRICQFNGGAPGVDGQTFEDIEAVRTDEVAGRTGGRTSNEAVSSRACTEGSHPQAGQAGTNQTAGNSDDQRSCRDDGCDAGSWSRSSRPTCSRNNTPIARIAVRWTLLRTSEHCCTRGIGR